MIWDARTPGEWCRELDGAYGVVNLAGRSVDCIKTPDHQDEILRSRVEATRALGAAVRSIESPPPVWVQMSTAHIYGDPPDVICSEGSEFGYGLAPFVGRAWEDAFRASILPWQRAVVLRTGFVLGRDQGAGSGALSRLAKVVKLGLGGNDRNRGTQGMSWIHERDLNRIVDVALDSPVDAGRLRGLLAQSRFGANLHARTAPRGRNAIRSAGIRLDGTFRSPLVSPYSVRTSHCTDDMSFLTDCRKNDFNFKSRNSERRSTIITHLPPPRHGGYDPGMTGEQFLAVLGVGFGAFIVWLIVRIINLGDSVPPTICGDRNTLVSKQLWCGRNPGRRSPEPKSGESYDPGSDRRSGGWPPLSPCTTGRNFETHLLTTALR